MPTLKVEYVNAVGVAVAPTPTYTDPSTPVGHFNIPHPLTVTRSAPLPLSLGTTVLQIYARRDGVSASFEANSKLLKTGCV